MQSVNARKNKYYLAIMVTFVCFIFLASMLDGFCGDSAWPRFQTDGPKNIGDIVFKDCLGEMYGRDGTPTSGFPWIDEIMWVLNHPGHVGIWCGDTWEGYKGGVVIHATCIFDYYIIPFFPFFVIVFDNVGVIATQLDEEVGTPSFFDPDGDGILEDNNLGYATHKSLPHHEKEYLIRCNLVKLAIKQHGEEYDYLFNNQKGPDPLMWTCCGLVEKLYESAAWWDQNDPPNYGLRYGDFYGDESKYDRNSFPTLNITPDAYIVHNTEYVWHCETNVEFSQCPNYYVVNLFMGRQFEGYPFVFFPWTQYNQSTLQDSVLFPGPTGVDAQPGASEGTIALEWDHLSGATGYEIYYDEDSDNPPYSPDNNGIPPSGSYVGFIDTVIIQGLTPGQRYYLSVRARLGMVPNWISDYSEEAVLNFPPMQIVFEFISDREEWVTGGAPPVVFSVPGFSWAPDYLKMTSSTNTNTFGYWQSPVDAVLADSDYLYRARFNISTATTDQAIVPQIRLRVNSSNLQQYDVLSIESAGDGGASPTTAGTDYDLYFVPPGNSSFTILAFDLLNFNPFDAAVAELSLDTVTVDRFALDSLPTPTVVQDYDFELSQDGWITGGAPIVFRPPQYIYSAGALELRATTNTDTFGFWANDPVDITIEADRLYRGTFEVRTDVTNPALVPEMRLRFNTGNLQASHTFGIVSIGDGANSPGTITNTTYDRLYFLPPANCVGENLLVSFDILNFNPGDAPTASLILDRAIIETLSPPNLP